MKDPLAEFRNNEPTEQVFARVPRSLKEEVEAIILSEKKAGRSLSFYKVVEIALKLFVKHYKGN